MSNDPHSVIEQNISTVTARIFELILQMPFEARKQLLEHLETNLDDGKRRTPRERYYKDVDFATKDRVFRGFIQNISADGVLIETGESVDIGQEIVLAFQLPNTTEHIKIKGKIVRILPSGGFGVKFETPIQNYSPH
jgi:hypothetical protein